MLFRSDFDSGTLVQPVTAALFADLDRDGLAELVVATAWGAVHVFQNVAGRLVDRTEAWGLGRYRGIWNDLAVVDLDEDGRLEIVAGNWGRNHAWQRFLNHPVRLYPADPEGAGSPAWIEAVRPPGASQWFPVRDFKEFRDVLPAFAAPYRGYTQFASAPVDRKSTRLNSSH